MSVIGKLPYVHYVFSKLSSDALNRLNLLVNDVDYENGIRLRLSNLIEDLAPYASDSSHGVRYVQLTIGDFNARVYKGFLITYEEVKFGFFTFQDGVEPMQAFKIELEDGRYKATSMYQNLTAEEFRRCLDDYIEEKIPDIDVTADIVDSGSATNGQVLTANGRGGAVWGSVRDDVLDNAVFETFEENDETYTKITFPDEIVPLKLCLGAYRDNFYFDYLGGYVLDESDNEAGSVVVYGEHIEVTLYSTHVRDRECDGISYCKYDAWDEYSLFNTYSLLHPITSASVVYKHDITVSWDNGNSEIGLSIFMNKPYPLYQRSNINSDTLPMIFGLAQDPNGNPDYICLSAFSMNNGKVTISGFNLTQSTNYYVGNVNIVNFTDTVTKI